MCSTSDFAFFQIRERALQTATPLNPQRVFFELSPCLPKDAIVCADSGTTTVWLGRIVRNLSLMNF
jgi:pyruvate dehydrogenase (quinone)